MATQPPGEEAPHVAQVPDAQAALLTGQLPQSPQSAVSEARLLRGRSASLETRSVLGSLFSTSHFNSFVINDLTNYSMNDQRWTLQRKKIGLRRKTKGVSEKKSRDLRSRDMTLNFVQQFKKKECIKFVETESRGDASEAPGRPDPVCHCGLRRWEHLSPAPSPLARHTAPDTSVRLGPDPTAAHPAGGCIPPSPRHPPIAEEEDQDFAEKILKPCDEEGREAPLAGTHWDAPAADGLFAWPPARLVRRAR